MNRALLNSYEKDLKIAGGKRWFCKTCNENLAKNTSIGTPRCSDKREVTLTDIMQKLESMEQKYEYILAKYEEQQNINQTLKSEIEHLKNQINKPESRLENSSVDAFQELSDREYRKRNVIMFSAKELETDNQEEKKEADLRLVKEIIMTASPNLNMEDVKVQRIGKEKADRIRPLKIRLPSAENVKQILFKTVELKKQRNLSSIVFSYDRTPKQIDDYKQTKRELIRRTEVGENGLKIKYVKGVPTIVKAKN